MDPTTRTAGPEPASPPKPATPRLVGVVWALLLVNTLGSQGAETLVPIPRELAQIVTMGAIVLAFGLALLLNPRIRVRPSAFLLLLTLLLFMSVAASARLESGYGSLFRCVRLAFFVATLWLLSCWWNDALTFVRHHIRALLAVLATVVAGLLIAPGSAMPDELDGRLVGILWPLPPAQVGQYGAVVAGLAIVLWMGRRTDARSVLLVGGVGVGVLLLSHARTATLGLLAALLVAALSLLSTSARARRVVLWGSTAAGLLMLAFGPAVLAWLQRGQDRQAIANLTGRQKVWDALLTAPRPTFENLFGIGLTNKSFGGLAIDNGWLAVYLDQGLVGVAIVAALIGALIVAAVLRPPSIQRACAIFLITYCVAASYTEAGLGDASTYLLHLTVAAALLAHTRPRTVPEVTRAR